MLNIFLIELSYFDAICFTIVDPMHNLFLGTAKHTMKNLWLENSVLSKAQMKTLQTHIDTIEPPEALEEFLIKLLHHLMASLQSNGKIG